VSKQDKIRKVLKEQSEEGKNILARPPVPPMPEEPKK
jgi:hypothetical protein